MTSVGRFRAAVAVIFAAELIAAIWPRDRWLDVVEFGLHLAAFAVVAIGYAWQRHVGTPFTQALWAVAAIVPAQDALRLIPAALLLDRVGLSPTQFSLALTIVTLAALIAVAWIASSPSPGRVRSESLLIASTFVLLLLASVPRFMIHPGIATPLYFVDLAVTAAMLWWGATLLAEADGAGTAMLRRAIMKVLAISGVLVLSHGLYAGAQTSELWVFLVTPLFGLAIHAAYIAIFFGLTWLLPSFRLRQAVAV